MRRGARLALAVAVTSMALAVLAGAWNRGGGSGGVRIEVDRDAWVSGGHRRGEAATLRLQYVLYGEGPLWLDDAKLETLGFGRERTRNPLPRLVHVVLQRDTMLTIVDAGRDRGALSAAWPDREHHVILRGVIGTHLTRSPVGAPGYIQSLVPKELYLRGGRGEHRTFRLRAGRLGWPVLEPED